MALAVKDWRLFFADRRAALLSFTVPIVLASAFGLIFHRPTSASDSPRLPLLIVAEDDGTFTKGIVADLLASPRIEAEVTTRELADTRVVDRKPGICLILPAGFESISKWSPTNVGERPRLEIRHNPLSGGEAQWAEGVVSEVILRKLAHDRLAPLLPQGQAEAAIRPPFDVATTAVNGTHAGFNSYTHSFNGMTLQYLLFWGMESGLLLLRERQRSLWLRMRAAPVPLWCLLLGKAFSTAAIALMLVMATFGFGYIVFGVRVSGSIIGFVMLSVGVSALAAATGLLVAAVGGTEARARSVCILVILGVSMLGGLWLPSFVLPEWARDVSMSLPTTWAMRGFDGVTWQGRGLLAALPSVSMVAGFTALFLIVAVARLVTSEARRRRGMA